MDFIKIFKSVENVIFHAEHATQVIVLAAQIAMMAMV